MESRFASGAGFGPLDPSTIGGGPMSDGLKAVFRPSWKKVVASMGIGAPLTVAGYLFAVQYHGPDYYPYLAAILLLPVWLIENLWWLHWVQTYCDFSPTGFTNIAVGGILQFLYYYTVISLIGYLVNRIRQ